MSESSSVNQPYTMDVEHLIKKIKENSAIFDTNDKYHSDRNFIASVWKKIGEDLSMSGDHAKRKWHQLRSNYMRVRRSEKNKPSGSVAKPRVKWPYYDLMSFLGEFSESREIADNVKLESPNQQPSFDENEHETSTNGNVPEDKVPTASKIDYGSIANAVLPETTNSTACRRKTFKRRKEAAVVDDDLEYLSESRIINPPRPEENDPDRMFLLSLLPSIKQLTPSDNMDFKLYTLQFLKSRLNLGSTDS